MTFEATVGTAEFPEVCAECRAPKQRVKVGKGRAAKSFLICTACEETPALPEKQGRKKCSPKNAKAKGDEGERETRKFLEELGLSAYRTAGSGAHGTKNNETAFATDVRAKFDDLFTMRVESKRKAKVAGVKSLCGDMAESEALRVRQDFEDAYWFIPENKFGELLKWAVEGMKGARRD